MTRKPLAALVAAAFALPAFAAPTPHAPPAPPAAPAPMASPAPAAPFPVTREIVIERDGDVLMHNDTLGNVMIASAGVHKVDGDAWRRWADDFSREMRSSVGTMFSQRVDARRIVKGAPYSAEVVTELNQQLPDGNSISRKTSGRVYRDGEGRTRQETQSEGKSASIHIHDPVEGKRYIANDGKRVVEMSTPKAADLEQRERERAERSKERAEAAAERSRQRAERDAERAKERAERMKERGESRSESRQVVKVGGTEIRIENGRVFIDGQETTNRFEKLSPSGKTVVVENGRVTVDGKELRPPTPPTAPLPPGTFVQRHHVTKDGKEVNVQTFRTGDGREIHIAPPPPVPPVPPVPGVAPVPPVPPVPPMPGLQTLRFESTAKLGKGVTTSLGVRDFDGVKAEGKSTVWTIPAGEIGNRNPINITSETWYSPELQVTVMSRYNDPRTGESVYRLANIQRAEPSPDLFKAPEKSVKR
jgi:hypothetical protein